MFDLIIRNASLPDGRRNLDVGIRDGRIHAVQACLPGACGVELNAGGRLLSPPFVDAHFHMDSTLTYGVPRVNWSGTLLEGIALWGELKPRLTQDALVERAMRYCDWAVARGLLAIRSHVDVCDPRLLAVEALLDVKARVKPGSTCSWWRFRRMDCCARRMHCPVWCGRWTWGWRWWGAYPITSAPWPMGRNPSAS